MYRIINANQSRRGFIRLAGASAVAASTPAIGGLASSPANAGQDAASYRYFAGRTVTSGTVAASPTEIPKPITRARPATHDVELVSREVTAEIAPGVTHRFMTFNGQVPAPMIRVRQGDTVNVRVTNAPENMNAHSVDLHAVYGSGGGAAYTEVPPGKSKEFSFKALYPGAFIYHCGVDNLDQHISRGMFGMILVEPEGGLPAVDREVYLGQHELYTKSRFAEQGEAEFDERAMINEDPTYVLFNGAVAPFSEGSFGPIKAKVGETLRIFFVCGGPNLTSSLHPIGAVWRRCWPQGGLANDPLQYIQTWPVSPGSAFVGDIELPVPITINVVDHAVSRVVNKGLLAQIAVEGESRPSILDAS